MARRSGAAALAAVAVLLLAAGPALAARDVKQLGSLINTVTGTVSTVVTTLLGPSLSYVSPTLGTIGITSQALNGALTIEPLPNTPTGYSPLSTTPLSGPFLYVWNAYGKSYTDPLITLSTDFLAVVDLNKASPTYKQVIHIENLPNAGNEPHHVSISYDRTRLLGGGLLSFLKRQTDHFAFDIETDPRRPRLLPPKELPLTAVTDHVFGLKNGKFLVTQMGSKIGGSPGGISIWDKNLNTVTTYPTNPPADLDPHGADVSNNTLVTSDFVLPVSTVTAQALTLLPVGPLLNPADITPLTNIVTRNTVRVWDLNDLSSIKKTIVLPGAQGVIDIKIIPGPNNPNKLAYATGVFNGGLYLVNPTAGTAQEVINFGVDAHPHLLAPASADGTRFFLTLNKAGFFLLLDTTVKTAPKVIQAVYLGDGASPHYITPIGPNDNRVAVADYFLDQGVIGKVHAGGNKKVFVFPYTRDKIDQNNALVFNFGAINGRPHGIATNLQYTDVEA